MAPTKRQGDTELLDQTSQRTATPKLYRVILHNDHYTTMEFVVHVLESVFNKTPAEAYRIMMLVHVEGHGLCGLYPYEIAETHVDTVHEMAHEAGFPLRASLEEE
jgi:ATP-dependent Clp protease adaptor protein ClpS